MLSVIVIGFVRWHFRTGPYVCELVFLLVVRVYVKGIIWREAGSLSFLAGRNVIRDQTSTSTLAPS